MWFLASGIIVLFLFVNPTVSKEICSDNVIKEAILSLARIMRENNQKLERHEARERHLGEQMKIAVAALTRKVSNLDTFVPNFTKIDNQISEIEQLISQKDERERIQIAKTVNLIENLEIRLRTQLDEIKDTISELNERMEPTEPTPITASVSSLDIMSKLNDTEAHFIQKIGSIEASLNTMAIKNRGEAATQAETLQTLLTERSETERIQMQETKDLLENLENRLERRLDEINDTISEVNNRVQPTEPTPIAETVSALDIVAKLHDSEALFLQKIGQIEFSLGDMAVTNNGVAVMQAEKLQTLLTERNERERIQFQKTENLIESLENRLERRLDEINNTISEVNDRVEPTQPTPTAETVSGSDIIDKLNQTEAHFLKKVAQIGFTLDDMATTNQNATAMQSEILQIVSSEVNNITGRLGTIESFLEEAHQAAERNEYQLERSTVGIGAVIEEQSRALGKITELVENTVNGIQKLPTTFEVQALHNETEAVLRTIKYALEDGADNKTNQIITGIRENNGEIKNSIGALRSDLANNAAHVYNNAMADQVLDTRKRVEFGVHQILSEVGELIRDHGELINKTLSERFDGISHTVMDDQNKTLAKLSSTMEEELNQVWRQVLVMNQQITRSGEILEKLRQQNEVYLNGTTSSMDGMETKVGDIKTRIGEVDGTLNFLIGRLSLVTQEFKRIKTDLVTALDDIKASFKDIQEKANDLTKTGPYPVPGSHQEFDYDGISHGFDMKTELSDTLLAN